MASQRFRHTWPQRLIFGFNIVVAVALLVGGGALVYANQRVTDRKVVSISGTYSQKVADGAVSADELENIPEGDLSAKNFLITGRDNNECVDSNSKYGKTVEGRSGYAGLTDTIMIIRVDPAENKAAVLSFPRDLYVRIAKSDSKNRINTAFRPNEPQRLVDTIMTNFGVGVDHYIAVDFCAFKTIVNAVGGVRIPFAFAARDKNTVFEVKQPGCAELDGDAALAYVRSRHYAYFDPKKNKWISDPSGDWGRIARQQDFLRRVLRAALDKGVTNPAVANQLLGAALDNVVTDDNLSPLKMLQLARAMRNVSEKDVRTYTVNGAMKQIGGQSVIEPTINNDTMKAILSIFRGETTIGEGNKQLGQIDAAVGSTRGVRSANTSTTTTVPEVVNQTLSQQRFSVTPPNDPTCR
ncbi:MAG: LytR family transcriptional regulator [Actinobacteria bacterium]|jgi:LCP family protein required for cell wall assembly|nr:LytR family transcriptional regulator [Actinomycetota bacterium]NBP53691.1 LytR family transcriptional regulator [Actinomycetota bacterium]